MGVLRPSDRAVQVIVGPIADQVAEEIREAGAGAPAASVAAVAEAEAPTSVDLSPDLVAALGGAAAIVRAQPLAGRVRVELREPRVLDGATLPGVRAFAQTGPSVVHLLV